MDFSCLDLYGVAANTNKWFKFQQFTIRMIDHDITGIEITTSQKQPFMFVKYKQQTCCG